MKRQLKLAVGGLIIIFILTLLGATAFAWSGFKSGQSVTVAKGETIDGSLWTGARDLTINGTVNGDLICGAQTLDISGTVKGDVICGAMTVNISGTVEGNVRVAGQTVNLSGSIGRNASIAGQTINIDGKSRIAGDASIAGSNLNLNGQVGRDLSFAAATASIGGQVGRDISATSEHIYLAGGASVGGGINYTSKNKLTNNGANVGGAITQHLPKKGKGHIASLLFFGGFAVLLFFMMLVSALVAVALLPQLFYKVTSRGLRRPWAALGIGVLANLIAPIIFIVLLATVVGLPLAILFMLAWLLINLSSGMFSAFWLGRQVWRSQEHALLVILVGAVLLLLLYLIPVVGIIALVLAVWLGEGMLLMTLYDFARRPDYRLKTKTK